jgi:hypothetical protein
LPLVEPLERRELFSADLTAAFEPLPAMLPSGGGDQVTVRLENVGSSAQRGRVTVSLLASSDGSTGPGATLLTSAVEPVHLNVGKSVSLALRFLSPASLPDGNYFLVGEVSAAGIASSQIVSAGPVTIIQPFVDLTSRIATLPVSAVGTGRRLSQMTIDVTNQGNVAAIGRVSIEVYVSVDGKLDDSAIPLNVSLPRSVHILPGKTVPLKVFFTALPGVPPGQYYLLAQVNPGRGIVDRDAANNLSASAYPVQVVHEPRRHGWECYLLFDNDYPADTYIDTVGDNGSSPVDTTDDSGAATTDTTPVPTPNSTPPPTTVSAPPPSTNPTTQPATDPTTQPSTDPSDGGSPTDSIPDPTGSDDSSGETSDPSSSDVSSSGDDTLD